MQIYYSTNKLIVFYVSCTSDMEVLRQKRAGLGLTESQCNIYTSAGKLNRKYNQLTFRCIFMVSELHQL